MKIKSIHALAVFLTIVQMLSAQAVMPVSDELEKNFVNPPDSAKPSCYWWWLNANVDKEAITRDMEQFRAKGIGSVLLVSTSNWCGPNSVLGPAFLSDKWRELFKFALQEANRVGIKVDVNLAPGWNMGGPWVTPDKASRWYLQSETNVVGPQKLSGQLPFPKATDGYNAKKAKGGVRKSVLIPFKGVDYRDTAVVAFRTPKGERPPARIEVYAKSNRQDADCFITSDGVMSYVIKPWTSKPEEQALRMEDVVDLTSRMKPDGTLDWEVPEGDWTILRTGHRMTGHQLSVPMIGQGGLENDYLDRAGIDVMFDSVAKILIEDAGPLAGNTLRGFCEDSFEAGYPNWTANMLKHFKHYRGYDPTPYLPVLKGWIVGNAEVSDRFLHDYRKTVADCFADEHYGRFEERSRQHNMVTRCESAGPSWSGTVCMDGLKNLGRAEFPQGEFWRDGTFVENGQNKVTKMVATAAHIYGKRYVAAEALTDATEGKIWGKAPSHFKPSVDRALCEGINQMVFHTMTCQRPSEGKPGLEYGAGTHFNPNVTWWDQTAGSWIGYINRCQALLQSGLFVADVLYYNGDGAPNLVGPKQLELPGLGKGYDYDFCNAEVLLTRLSVKDGRVVLPDGMSYRVLVLPESRRMPVEVASKIKELVQAGATIVGPKPESDSGLKGYPQCDADVKKIAAEIWGACDGQQVKQNTFGKGRVFWGKTLGEILLADGVLPDFTYSGDAFIDFIHRSAGGAEIYFLANRKGEAATVEATFRVSGKQPELWDAVSGQRRDLTVFESKDGCTTVPLEFEPDGSMFIVFRKAQTGMAPGADRQANFRKLEPRQEITGPWTVQFDPEWFYPTNGLSGDQAKGLMTFDKLEDWTLRQEPAVKHFSGTAVYRKSFVLADASLKGHAQTPICLELGTVKESARVKLNGKDLGVVWCHPWRVEITSALKPGENQLEIEVVNLWPNRLIGDRDLPAAQRRTRTNLSVDPKQNALPSGLIGPVRILGPINPPAAAGSGPLKSNSQSVSDKNGETMKTVQTSSSTISRKRNPIFENIYTADPSARVWEDGRLYVYPSQDIAPPRGCDLMDKYHVYSTDDLVTWVDHGQILEAADVPWGRPEGGFMWAPDCAYRNGTYYFYFPHPSGAGSAWNDTWKIGVATSKHPHKDFTCQGYIEGMGGRGGIDPAVFIDDDGTAWMVYGGSQKCSIGKLKQNMVELDGPMTEITKQLHKYHEGPWLWKRKGIYYLMYPDNHVDQTIKQPRNKLHYSMAPHPMGPYKYGGEILGTQSSDTSHGSVVEFKGEWWLFYHNSELSKGVTNLRSVAMDRVIYNEDGTIQKVVQTF